MGQLQVLASFPPMNCGGEIVGGLLEVPVADILGAFIRDAKGQGGGTAQVFRLRHPGASAWCYLRDDAAGATVSLLDLLVTRTEAERFEEEHEIFGRRPTVVRVGQKERFDWDGAVAFMMKRIHDHGIPQTQSEMVEEIADWFTRRAASDDDVPDVRSIRRRISLYWNALREEGPLEAAG